MNQQDAVRRCTAKVQLRREGRNAFAGSGFFVGQGLVLTCSHVIGDRDGADLVISWSNKEWPCVVEAELPAPFPKDGKLGAGLPDLAMLSCGASNREALLLDPEAAAGLGSKVFFYGFSEEADGEVVGHPLRCNIEGEIDVEPHWRLLKFDSGRILRGQSGCAVVSEDSGLVVAMAKRRVSGQPDASYGIPASVVLDALPKLAETQRDYRQKALSRSGAEPLLALPEPNPFFFPRAKESRQLADALNHSGVVALLGLAGVGKSALAREHVLDSGSRYAETLWLDARDEAIVRCRLSEIAQRLQFSPEAPGLEALAAAVYTALDRAAQAWLLVLDGLEDVSLGRRLLPAGANARTLITSRLDDLRLLGARNPVRLGPLDPAAAERLVNARLGGVKDAHEAKAIAGSSGKNPGALEQAAAAALHVKATTGQWPGKAPEFIERVQAALGAEPGGTLLRLLAVLADAPFPIATLARAPEDRTPRMAAEALTVTSLAWTDPLGESITLDAQTREAALPFLDKPQLQHWRGLARDVIVNILGSALPRADSRRLILLLVPHAMQLIRASMAGKAQAEDLLLRTLTARGFMSLGDYSGADTLLTEILSNVMAPGAPVYGARATVEYLATFAKMLITMGRLDGVEPLLNRADELARTCPLNTTGEPPDIAAFIRVNISASRGELRAAEGKHREALELLVPALEYFARHPRGSIDARLTLEAVIKSMLFSATPGQSYAVLSSNEDLVRGSLMAPGTGDIGKAVAWLPRLAEGLKGTVYALEAEARVYLYLGIACFQTAGNIFPGSMFQLQNAENYFERALKAAERALPDPSEVTASCCANLGMLMNRCKGFRGASASKKAITYLRRAIDIRTRMYGESTPRLKETFYQLAVALIDTEKPGNLDEAESCLRRALAGQPDDKLASKARAELKRIAAARRGAKG